MSASSSSRPAGTGSDTSSERSPAAQQARAVRRYLSAVEADKRGRGVKRTADAIGNRITKLDELLVSADPLTRVHLTQERIELHAEHVRLGNGNHTDMAQLERDFVRVARRYGDRNGLTYAAWRQVGVDSKVLDRAGIRRAEKKPPPAAARAAAEKPAIGREAIGDTPTGREAQDASISPTSGDQHLATALESTGGPPAPRRTAAQATDAPDAPRQYPPPPSEPAPSPPSAPRPPLGTEVTRGGNGSDGGVPDSAPRWSTDAGERGRTEAGDDQQSASAEDLRPGPSDVAALWADRGAGAPPPPPDGEADARA